MCGREPSKWGLDGVIIKYSSLSRGLLIQSLCYHGNYFSVNSVKLCVWVSRFNWYAFAVSDSLIWDHKPSHLQPWQCGDGEKVKVWHVSVYIIAWGWRCNRGREWGWGAGRVRPGCFWTATKSLSHRLCPLPLETQVSTSPPEFEPDTQKRESVYNLW